MVTTNDNQAVKQEDYSESMPAIGLPEEVFGLPPEEQPPYVSSGDDNTPNPAKETKSVPYARFKEVIDERNKLRTQIDAINTGTRSNQMEQTEQNNRMETLSDDELNTLWAHNPSYAAKAMFAKVLGNFYELSNRKDENYQIALQKYPQLQDINHELTLTTQDIMRNEMPELKSDPKGILIASEMAAARFYKNQYERIAKQHGVSMKNLEAMRSANLKGAYIEHSNLPSDRTYHDCLSDEEHKVAKLMGVPAQSYLEQKIKRHNSGGKR